MFPQSFLHYHIVILPSQPTCYSVYLWYIRNIKHISTGDWVQFTCWWFGVVLSQVIPSEVQDSTGDNIEKPGKTLNGETSMCLHILNFVCPLISSVDGESSVFFFQLLLVWCTICVAKLTSNMAVVFFIFYVVQDFFWHRYVFQYVAAVSSCRAQSLDRESLVVL